MDVRATVASFWRTFAVVALVVATALLVLGEVGGPWSTPARQCPERVGADAAGTSENYKCLDTGMSPGQTHLTWDSPVPDGIVSGYRTKQRPDHDGVDLGAERGASIAAAAAGTVITVTCDVRKRGKALSCDRDGSPSIRGCGWQVDIAHPDGSVTRYCHMLKRPSVHEGQEVATGESIGVVGTSGNSSEPHLHFEALVHCKALNHDVGARGCVHADPVAFLAERGVRLKTG